MLTLRMGTDAEGYHQAAVTAILPVSIHMLDVAGSSPHVLTTPAAAANLQHVKM